MANSIANSILESAWALLRTNGSTTDIPALQEESMLKWLSKANMDWMTAFKRGGGSGPLGFLRETGFILAEDTAIDDVNGITSASNSITVDSQSFPDEAGAAIVWDEDLFDIFYYTSQTPTLFSGVTELAFDHDDDDVVQALYKLPATFKEFRAADGYGDGVKIGRFPYFYMEGPPTTGYFSKYDDGTDNYLWLPQGLTGKASVLFNKKSATIDTIDDTVDVPVEHEFFLVWRVIQMATIPKEGAQPSDLYVLAKNEASTILKDALNDKSIRPGVKVRSFRLLGRSIDPSLNQRVPR